MDAYVDTYVDVCMYMCMNEMNCGYLYVWMYMYVWPTHRLFGVRLFDKQMVMEHSHCGGLGEAGGGLRQGSVE